MIASLRGKPIRRAPPRLSLARLTGRLTAALPARRADDRPRCEQCGRLAWDFDIYGVAQCRGCARI